MGSIHTSIAFYCYLLPALAASKPSYHFMRYRNENCDNDQVEFQKYGIFRTNNSTSNAKNTFIAVKLIFK